ncbi:uncharacterized protein LOC112680225 isoform X2 [Sipha flava]|uniref:Uncharacterized protein LOC112680225 isoform X2 n=1 Tax=Sipha flava TaxID=143950 RepID=A0A8B8F5G0_9HEMI|nr:uncharacterized protein LOC112680225 isoform X2 [Sipha flava]
MRERLIQQIVRHPINFSERDVFEFFRQRNSTFVLSEINIKGIHGVFCSIQCGQYNNQIIGEYECINFEPTAYDIMFKDVEVLQAYSRIRRCPICNKYLTICNRDNLYATPDEDFTIYIFNTTYNENRHVSTIHI